jgi:hypothetical protein
MPPAPIEVMEKRRRNEDVKIAEEKRLLEVSKVTQYAQWENETDQRIVDAEQAEHLNRFAAAEDAALNQRRHELANLYDREMKSWKYLLENSKETTEERKAKIRERANALKAKREAGNADYVRAMRQKQWRNGCDDLRDLDTQATVQEVARRRQEQLVERAYSNEREATDEKEWDKAWDSDRLRKEERERRDAGMQRKRNTDMKRDLDIQVRQASDGRRLMTDVERTEAEETKARWQQEEDEQNRYEMSLKAALRAEGKRVQLDNNERQKLRGIKATEEMQNDLILLQVALEKERRELEEEEEKKRQEKESTKKYQELLKLQMVKEKQDDSLLEELRRQDSERETAKRDAQHGRESKARKELQDAVMQGRREQEEQRRQLKVGEREADRVYALEQKQVAMQLDQAERELRAFQGKNRLENQQGVRAQITARQMLEQKQQQSIFIENKTMQHFEKQYQAQLKEVKDSYRL